LANHSLSSSHLRRTWVLRLALILLLLTGLAVSLWQLGTVYMQPPEQREALELLWQKLHAEPDSVGGNWLRTMSPAMQRVQGDLIWSQEQQLGVMRLLNLPDPPKGQHYQLWIYDSRSPDNMPFASTTLDQGSGKQERYVRFQGKSDTPITAPYKFVLTQEPDNDTVASASEARVLLMVQP